jgi:hypothetical protein
MIRHRTPFKVPDGCLLACRALIVVAAAVITPLWLFWNLS